MAPIKTPIDAEARGKVRLLRASLTKSWARIDRFYKSDACYNLVGEFAMKSSAVGRSRALEKACKALGKGAHLERADIAGSTAVWAYFEPRDHVETTAPIIAQQRWIDTGYFAIGRLPGVIGKATGSWTILFADHAIGRLFQRSPKSDPVKTMLAAHRAIMKARDVEVLPFIDNDFNPDRALLVPVPGGCFVCNILVTRDISLDNQRTINVFARTFIDDGLMRDDQRSVMVDAGPGEHRMGDSWLAPMPWRRFSCEDLGDGMVKMQAAIPAESGATALH